MRNMLCITHTPGMLVAETKRSEANRNETRQGTKRKTNSSDRGTQDELAHGNWRQSTQPEERPHRRLHRSSLLFLLLLLAMAKDDRFLCALVSVFVLSVVVVVFLFLFVCFSALSSAIMAVRWRQFVKSLQPFSASSLLSLRLATIFLAGVAVAVAGECAHRLNKANGPT